MTEAVEVNGIVLSSMPVGESDRRLSILTKELGRISAFARGARKPTSSLIAATRPFATGKFFIYPGRDAFSLNKAEISEHFEEIVKDVEKTAYGSYFLELATRFSHEHFDGGNQLNLLYLSLKALLNEKIPLPLTRRVYELKTLTYEGVIPEFSEGQGAANQFSLSKSAVFALRFIRETELKKLYTFTVTPEVLWEIARVSEYFVSANIDRPLKSAEMIEILTNT